MKALELDPICTEEPMCDCSRHVVISSVGMLVTSVAMTSSTCRDHLCDCCGCGGRPRAKGSADGRPRATGSVEERAQNQDVEGCAGPWECFDKVRRLRRCSRDVIGGPIEQADVQCHRGGHSDGSK